MNKLVVAGVSLVTFLVYLIFLTVPTFNYGRMVLAFFIVAAIGIVGMLVARYAVCRTMTVVLNGVGIDYALRSASHAVWVAEDHVIGWPSGTFEIKGHSDKPGFVATEWLARGSGNIVINFIRIPWKIVVVLSGAFLIFSWIGAIVAFFIGLFVLVMFAYFFVVPLAIAWLVEISAKKPLRSEIVVVAEQLDADTTQLNFEFRGVSALLVMNNVLNAFSPPVLPGRFAALVAEPTSGAAPRTAWNEAK